MKSLLTFKKLKKAEDERSQTLEKPSSGSSQNVLTSVTLTGVIVPWSKKVRGVHNTEYKLVCKNGHEYFLTADDQWRRVLSWYRWEDVRVVGLLNSSNMTVIPQWVFPKGPKSSKANVIDFALWNNRKAIKKWVKKINDSILLPVAAFAITGF